MYYIIPESILYLLSEILVLKVSGIFYSRYLYRVSCTALCISEYSIFRHNSLAVDRYLMVYDLRMLRAINPMQTVLDPFFLKFIPSISSRLAVVSALGQIQLLDTIALAEPRLSLLQMENPGAMCLTFDISTSGQILACGDNTGHIHVFASTPPSSSADNPATPEPLINTYSRPCELPDEQPVDYPNFGVDDFNTPLSVIPMPVMPLNLPLASDWPPELIKKIYRKSPGIDPEILGTMKMQGPIGYAPNPKTSRRNQVRLDKLSTVYFC
ncbi:unnamed protein product [Acanthoscelides obtectus]|uniref:PAN2-PAN3 deadenylation complex catalytic subunit PAN2 N-terminal domain-containing protein n=1 Tax=Acanthoscelides obtectus TaxID=200917 RepID=A0A9P0K0C9_ACAOB|nr:unnamed protein product [Acanthoscelides obtectus]CAK1647187.1 PAN2-PAN3 deadenylation complex catalytic subunit PAN2 [Acanthoscelides obtectus]